MQALLISEQRVKQLTNLDSNVRIEEITPFVIQSQDIMLQTRLGTLFYERLKEGVINNDLNSDETKLLNDYIAPSLAHYSVYLMLPGLKYKLVDKGVLSGSSEETTQTSLEELNYLRSSVKDVAEFYIQRMFEYLCDNSTLYPQYASPGPDGMYPSTDSAYFSGLVIPKPLYATRQQELCGNCEGNCGCDV
jgi:hypothetical protein